jgi:hypothetical protein
MPQPQVAVATVPFAATTAAFGQSIDWSSWMRRTGRLWKTRLTTGLRTARCHTLFV